jgi:peptidoglycan hydrolase CwlO-like protein
MKLLKKLQEQNESSVHTRSTWQEFQQSLDYRPDWHHDGICRQQVYLQLIAQMHMQQRMLSSLVDLKILVNHNEGKITVVRSKVHGISDVDHPPLTDSDVELHLEELEDKLKETQEESYDLDTEINAIRTKNNTIDREVKRSKADMDVRGIDEAIRDAKRKIERLEDML